PLWDRLDESRRLRIVPEHPAQFGDGPREHFVTDERVGPDGLKESVLRHHLARVCSKEYKDRHLFWLQPHLPPAAAECPQRGVDAPIANRESVCDGEPRAQRHPSTLTRGGDSDLMALL